MEKTRLVSRSKAAEDDFAEFPENVQRGMLTAFATIPRSTLVGKKSVRRGVFAPACHVALKESDRREMGKILQKRKVIHLFWQIKELR